MTWTEPIQSKAPSSQLWKAKLLVQSPSQWLPIIWTFHQTFLTQIRTSPYQLTSFLSTTSLFMQQLVVTWSLPLWKPSQVGSSLSLLNKLNLCQTFTPNVASRSPPLLWMVKPSPCAVNLPQWGWICHPSKWWWPWSHFGSKGLA